MVVATSVVAKADYEGGKAAILIGPDSFGLFIDKSHGRKAHGYKKYKYYGHKSGYWYKGHRGHKGYYGKKRYKGYGHKRGYGHKGGYGHKAYYGKKHYGGHGHGHGHYRKACHPVYKYGYHNGYRAKIGGTMCYDRYGNGYVVRGSRYVIEYY